VVCEKEGVVALLANAESLPNRGSSLCPPESAAGTEATGTYYRSSQPASSKSTAHFHELSHYSHKPVSKAACKMSKGFPNANIYSLPLTHLLFQLNKCILLSSFSNLFHLFSLFVFLLCLKLPLIFLMYLIFAHNLNFKSKFYFVLILI
jgi:hypothetical protein